MTPSLLETDRHVGWPERGPAARRPVTPGNQPVAWLPGVSGFVADTWIFFATPQPERTGDGRWGLGFGPADTHLPRWSLFHCVTEDHFDSRSICPQLNPLDQDLYRWASSTVGWVTATLLLEGVGSCVPFYRQYFAERPDLRYLGAR